MIVSNKFLMTLAAAAISLAALGCSVNSSTAICETPSPTLISALEADLTTEGDSTLRGTQAVRSKDYDEIWFVRAEIQAPGWEGDEDFLTWAVNDLRNPGMITPVGGTREFTTGGLAGGLSDRFSIADNGVMEAKNCTRSVIG
jgi:hypothetical protein